ncbi:hypothetical protein [Hydrocarboniphaga sp.]|uniref:hypothetical protein n=1 Tax=Hydrocarboniphaga sp. TaxID=2033016 RepID=UPI0026134199|nr:hypothetical protein [Hydrocarboniphaga sp.]
MNPNHPGRGLFLAAATLALAAMLCLYGFIKIVPLAAAHTGAASTASTSSSSKEVMH